MKKSYLFLFTSLLGLLVACGDKEEVKPVTNLSSGLTAVINGAQQVPFNPSTATGEFDGYYNSDAKTLTYTVNYRGMTPTSAHIHSGAPGQTGDVVIPFDLTTNPIVGTFNVTPELAEKLLNNGTYVNIHSTNNRAGEIRGDIKKK